jgi:hypothetical protein
MQLFINGIGICGPGLAGWEQACEVFLAIRPYCQEDLSQPAPTFLPPNELRRSSEVVKWSLQVAHEALQHNHVSAHDITTVFTTSGGESAILQQLCLALATTERVISPTLFHHSVHNAAAGYWSIGIESHQPSVSLSCYDSSFGGGLIEAGTYICVNSWPVLLVAYDLPPPPPLYTARPLAAPFATALLFSSQQFSHSLAQLSIQLVQGTGKETRMAEASLEILRKGNPAARALPLLSAIAKGKKTQVSMSYLDDNQLLIDVTPCQPCQN